MRRFVYLGGDDFMKADVAQLNDWLMRIDTFNATPGEGTTRAIYTKEFYRAREYLT